MTIFFVIQDIHDDERFAAILSGRTYKTYRFLITLSLKDPGGRHLGALILLDPNAGQLSTAKLQAIQTVTRQVENLLELRKTNNQLVIQQGSYREL